jgi:hypothetical protein
MNAAGSVRGTAARTPVTTVTYISTSTTTFGSQRVEDAVVANISVPVHHPQSAIPNCDGDISSKGVSGIIEQTARSTTALITTTSSTSYN